MTSSPKGASYPGMLLSSRKGSQVPLPLCNSHGISPVRSSQEDEGSCWLGGTEVASCHGEGSGTN